MKKIGRIGAVLAAAVAAAGMTTIAAASPASAAPQAPQGPRPVSDWLRAVPANTGSWINIQWYSGRPVCDAKVWVDGGRKVDVDYPGNRNYTSFSRGDTLRPGRSDVTAVRVTPRFNRAGIALLRATISYDNCSFHGRQTRDTTTLSLPVTWTNSPGHGNGGQPGHGNGGQPGGGHDGGQPGGGQPGGGHDGGQPGGGQPGGGQPGGGHTGGH
jgi:hypothetical protein